MSNYLVCLLAAASISLRLTWADVNPYLSSNDISTDSWHYVPYHDVDISRQSISRQGILGLLAAIGPQGLLASLILPGIGAAYTAVSSAVLQNNINNNDIIRNDVCNKVNEILDISALTSSETSLAAITNFQFSVWLGDADVGAATGSAVINGKTLDNS